LANHESGEGLVQPMVGAMLDQLFIPAAPIAQETAKFRKSLAKLA
jgi:hypothetical protein